MATVHKWEKYTIKTQFVTTGVQKELSLDCNTTVECYRGFTPDTLTKSINASDIQLNDYIFFNNETFIVKKVSIIFNMVLLYVEIVTIESDKGNYIEIVASFESNAYPQNGAQNNYWYVYLGSEEVFEPAIFATIDGVQRKLPAIPAMIDGVQRELSSLFATVDGVAREIFTASTDISFTIGGVAYKAERGMTWEQWCTSAYNTAGYYADTDIYDSDGNYFICYSGGSPSCKDTEVIQSGHAYTLEY